MLEGASSGPSGRGQQGHWEYQEFSEKLNDRPVYTYLTYVGKLGLWDIAAVEAEVNAGVKRLLARITPEGWEPIEPIEYRRLVAAGRVTYKWWRPWWASKNRSTLGEVRLNCRRWVQ
jgi:hypothetical protein